MGQTVDECAYHKLHPVRKPKYTMVKVLSTQDKHHLSWAASQSYAAAATAL